MHPKAPSGMCWGSAMLSRLEPTVTTQVLDTTAQILKLRTPTLMWVDPSLHRTSPNIKIRNPQELYQSHAT